MAVSSYKQTIMPTLSLFTSIGTLVCCALPALFVTLGMGAALAGLVANVPWLVAFSEYKIMIFALAGCLLLIASILQWRARKQACPTDIAQLNACTRLRKVSWIILTFAILIYAIGFFFAFVAADLLYT